MMTTRKNNRRQGRWMTYKGGAEEGGLEEDSLLFAWEWRNELEALEMHHTLVFFHGLDGPHH